jgi:hypothetical protein
MSAVYSIRVCLVLLRPMVVSQVDGHVCGVHHTEVLLGQVSGRESVSARGTLGSDLVYAVLVDKG